MSGAVGDWVSGDKAGRMAGKWLPPVVGQLGKRLVFGSSIRGDFDSWEAARAASTGYENAEILERTRAAMRLVKSGAAAQERDAVALAHSQLPWATLACLLQVAVRRGGALRVLDFGGALGTGYVTFRDFSPATDLEWSVVEQPHFVECGRREFEDASLRFYRSIDECLAQRSVDVFVANSVVQYLESPYAFMTEVGVHGFEHVLLDRTLIGGAGAQRLAVQYVSPRLYDASYPIWVLDAGSLSTALGDAYERVAALPAHGGPVFLSGDTRAHWRGFLWQRRPPAGGRGRAW